jgi:hypothetical protein
MKTRDSQESAAARRTAARQANLRQAGNDFRKGPSRSSFFSFIPWRQRKPNFQQNTAYEPSANAGNSRISQEQAPARLTQRPQGNIVVGGEVQGDSSWLVIMLMIFSHACKLVDGRLRLFTSTVRTVTPLCTFHHRDQELSIDRLHTIKIT